MYRSFINRKSKEKCDKIEDKEYIEKATKSWHDKLPESKDYKVCCMEEATHVVFTETDLSLAGEDGEGFTPYKIYPIKEDEYGDLFIISDNDEIIIGFDLFIPCEFLKEIKHQSNDREKKYSNVEEKSNVIFLSDYILKKRK